MQKTITRFVLILTAVGIAVFLSGIGLLASAQDPTSQNSNTNPASQSSPSKTTRRKTSKSNSNTGTTETQQDPTQSTQPTPATQPDSTTTPTTTARRGRSRSSASAQSAPMDLSGTYAGTFNCDEAGLTGDTTLTITGNQFTTADGRTGHVITNTSGGYTAVALQLDTPASTTAPATTATQMATPSPVISLRAKRSGNRLTLSPVSGSNSMCSFNSGRSMASRRRASQNTQTAAGADVSNPASAGPAPTDVTTPTTSRRTKSRRGTSRATTSTTPATTTMPSAVPSESPSQPMPETPMPNPSPSPRPSQMPSPMPSPTVSPSPSASPSPEGSPSPSPSPSPNPSPSPKPPRG